MLDQEEIEKIRKDYPNLAKILEFVREGVIHLIFGAVIMKLTDKTGGSKSMSSRYDFKPKPDFIGQTKGDKKQHLYAQPFGYPIRLCNWQVPETDFEGILTKPMCKQCEQMMQGDRYKNLPEFEKAL